MANTECSRKRIVKYLDLTLMFPRLVRNPMVAGRNLDYYRYDGRNIQGGREHLLACMRSITPEMVLEAIAETWRIDR